MIVCLEDCCLEYFLLDDHQVAPRSVGGMRSLLIYGNLVLTKTGTQSLLSQELIGVPSTEQTYPSLCQLRPSNVQLVIERLSFMLALDATSV